MTDMTVVSSRGAVATMSCVYNDDRGRERGARYMRGARIYLRRMSPQQSAWARMCDEHMAMGWTRYACGRSACEEHRKVRQILKLFEPIDRQWSHTDITDHAASSQRGQNGWLPNNRDAHK
jgi:hypothetical protein